MLKMMTYGEANQVLGSSLTPTNRCLTKSVAIEAGAAEDPLASFTSNRLVPASVVQPGHHVVIENYFVLEDGTYSTNPTVNIGLNDTHAIFRSILFVDGEIYKTTEDMTSPDSKAFASKYEFISSGCDVGGNTIVPMIQPSSDTYDTYDPDTGIFEHKIKLQRIGAEGAQGTVACSVSKTGLTNVTWMDDMHTIYITLVRTAAPPPTTYNIRFLDYDGTILKTQTVEEGNTPTAPNDPTRTDYNFTGWSPTISPATQDQDYTATYTQKPYRVTFRDDSQFGGSIITDHYYNAQENPVIPDAPQHTGYTHTGWTPQVEPVSSSVTYYATYQGGQPTEYTIRFLDYDGTVLKTQQCESGTTPTAPQTPLRPGYTFIGWSPSITAATKNQDYTATYRQESQDVYINIKITNSTGRTINVNGVYFTYSGGREAMYWYDNVDISNNRTYTKNNIQYYEEGSTISKIRVEYTTSSGEYQLVEIPTSDWHCPLVTELADGDTLSITLWD